MRCKNCGAENDDKRYICEVCGSPLYDENQLTQEQQPAAPAANAPANGDAPATPPRDPEADKQLQQKNKQSMIIIIVLCVVLIAVVTGIIIAVASGNKKEETTTRPDTTVASVTQEPTSAYNSFTEAPTQAPTETTTKKETTTKTETTTKKETTTKDNSVQVNIRTQGRGSVTGAGKYESGDNVTLTATPRNGYDFEGWYQNGELQSSEYSYSFTVGDNDMTITAKFIEAEPEMVPGDQD